MARSNPTRPVTPKWLYPAIYLLFLVINSLPVYAEKPYAPQDTQDVILNLLAVSIDPYTQLGPVSHIATLLILALIGVVGGRMGRILAAYMGLNYLIIGLVQAIGTTEKYGFVVHTGSLITSVLLGIAWIVAAVRGTLKPSYERVPPWRYLLLPLALLAFWAPYDSDVQPAFDPALLITSPDYGLTFCLTTPVFLFLLILFYPKVDAFAYRITAFNGLLYGLINMTHLLNPQLRWMGILHLPLLVISLCALLLPRVSARVQAVP